MRPPTSLTITNPLHLYRAHLASSRLLPDPHQHRAALLLQEVYHRLKDYSPPPELDTRLQNLSLALSRSAPAPEARSSFWSDLQRKRQQREALSLVRVLSSKDTVLEAATPQGFFLYGEVGTGKSLLLDLLYTSLPNSGKERWHFHAFMQRLYSALAVSPADDIWGREHALLRIARELVAESPIVFLDEIQFPDRASAKIVSELLVRFWSLGGVLVGSSNRAAGELVKAAGAGRSGEFDVFEECFQGRCECHRIDGTQDWRKARTGGWWRVGIEDAVPIENGSAQEFCFSVSTPDDTRWHETLEKSTNREPWEEASITVYGRQIHIPRVKNGVALFTFKELCSATLGPADYLALTSKCHTIFIDFVPQLSHANSKNEARRFITLLDAIYEAGVKLAIRSQFSIDELFFPAATSSMRDKRNDGRDSEKRWEYDMTGDSDSLHGEVFAEAYVDARFRPNIATTEVGTERSGNGAEDKLDFGNVAAFTGVDERFAAARAASRLHEVTGVGWWRGVKWVPPSMKKKEYSVLEEKVLRREEEQLSTLSPYRVHPEAPPKFWSEHFWSLGRWGRRAGVWGKGVDAPVGERKKEVQK